ncbi:hypothetical protein OTB20_19615 [Streptomyces sp. H27-H1]|uniref:hypothetical protein n=1 Tax=Streptomyces sp. H27-H1 TaxID=2996461 RepID=UPI002270E910|nr:hypothetical protein [Streptomyces sp. H27-H1]MCY0928366.1 hypothetical protein [Streptomyces sp. H27-H1]
MADIRIAAEWRAEPCSDEYRENCACIVVAGAGDRIQYIADAETPELAERIAADHNRVMTLAQAGAAGALS